MPNRIATPLYLILVLMWPATVMAHISSLEQHGHQTGEFYTAISIGRDRTDLLYTVPRAELSADAVTPEALLPLIETAFAITNDNAPCSLSRIAGTTYSAIDAFQYELSFSCGEPPSLLTIHYRAPVEYAWHITPVEVRVGDELSLSELGWRNTTLTIPLAQLVSEHNLMVPAQPAPLAGKAPVATDYFVLGFQHVLTGYDHMAFLLGLLIVVYSLRALILFVTSFTIAHSITLGLSATGILTLQVGFTEAAIAVTIIYIGAENLYVLLRKDEASPGLSRRWITTFVFGLIHGFGFSFLLREIGLPQDEFITALLLFNLGVEAAQICAVVIPFFIAHHFLRQLRHWHLVATALSTGILLVGCWWLIERTLL